MWLGIDTGTGGTRALLVSAKGEVVAACTSAHEDILMRRPLWAEQRPQNWWDAAVDAIRGVLSLAGAKGSDVHGIGLSGQMHGLVALDSAGRVLRPAILWNDQRTAAECEEIEATIGLARLIELTGNRALPGFTAPKLLWMRANEPELFARIARIALPKDYVRLRLCGEYATDVADASGTLLLDVAGRRWSREVLDALALPSEWLPKALESPQASGLTPDGVPVAAGAGDQAAGALGAGVDRAGGAASVVLGTSGVVFAALERYAADPQARVHAFCHALPATWHAMGVMLSAAGSLAWLQRVIGEGYDTLTAEARAWEPGTEGLLFLPYLAGERTPHADPDARGSFTGLELRHDRGALVRAVMEGVAFGLRDSLDLVSELGRRPEIGRVSGGGAHSDEWLRIIATVLELPLQRVAVEDAAAFGAALLGGVVAGVWPDVPSAVAATVRPGEVIEPVEEWIEPYRAARERFRALYPALRACR